MSRFLSPQEMFQEFIDEQHEKERRYDEFILDEMRSYAKEALNRMKCEIRVDQMAIEYLVAVAESYFELNKGAVKIFNRLGLQPIHASAVLEKFDWFKEEFEQILEDRREAQYS